MLLMLDPQINNPNIVYIYMVYNNILFITAYISFFFFLILLIYEIINTSNAIYAWSSDQ